MNKQYFAISALALSLGAASGVLTSKAYAAPASPIPAAYQEGGRWDEAPGEYRDAQRQGFHDGVEAARRDAQGRRHKDADDHQMYRHPPVERNLRDDYRNAFRQGYSRAMHHMREGHHDHDDARPY